MFVFPPLEPTFARIMTHDHYKDLCASVGKDPATFLMFIPLPEPPPFNPSETASDEKLLVVLFTINSINNTLNKNKVAQVR